MFSGLAKERYLRGCSRDEFVERLTHYFAEVNAIHPFRDGNGRTQRAFFRQLCHEAGWGIDWSSLDRDDNVRASIASLRGDNNRAPRPSGLVDKAALREIGGVGVVDEGLCCAIQERRRSRH
ncbi:Fic/DOC family protein [Nocardia sp. 2YAB30]|uniref:Fic/DOC family protein n=1 Tax=unclassified Nocardia TaxID=2637762 RepID=UPI003F9BA87B